ncbi:MAG: hypothetical protein V3S64_15375 [bacterium]
MKKKPRTLEAERKVDPVRYRESLANLQKIFEGISETVTEVSKERCPYKDASNACTAGFRCRNQVPNESGSDREFLCAGDNLNFEPFSEG